MGERTSQLSTIKRGPQRGGGKGFVFIEGHDQRGYGQLQEKAGVGTPAEQHEKALEWHEDMSL